MMMMIIVIMLCYHLYYCVSFVGCDYDDPVLHEIHHSLCSITWRFWCG